MKLVPSGVLAFLVLASAGGCAHRPADAARTEPWLAVRSQHFALHTNLATRQGYVLEQLELAYGTLRTAFFPDTELRDVPVVLFANDHHFHTLFGDWRSAAVLPEGVIVLSREAIDRPAHQVAHRLVQAALPRAPLWFHEGFADYVGTVEYRQNHAYFGARCVHADRSLAIVPARQLFAARAEDFDGTERQRHHASACMLVHFLLHGHQRQLRSAFPSFARVLGTGDGGERALAVAYPRISLDQLDHELRQHLWLALPDFTDSRGAISLPLVDHPIVARKAIPAAEMMALVERLTRAGQRARHQSIDWLPVAPPAAAAALAP